MQNTYVLAAFIIAWLALCIYIAILAIRMRNVRTELSAVEELVREQQERLETSQRVQPHVEL